MYNEPKFNIIELSDEDVILTSLIDGGNGGEDDIPTFDWPDNTTNP